LEDKIILSPLGRIVQECWRKIGDYNPHVKVDDFIVMPNHVHGLLFFDETNKALGSQRCSVNNMSGSLASVIGSFKSASARLGKSFLAPSHGLWQGRYYEHVIRSEKALWNARKYIRDNPVCWHLDQLNPGSRRW
jgi:REP element-mobilizing transposase RayT